MPAASTATAVRVAAPAADCAHQPTRRNTETPKQTARTHCPHRTDSPRTQFYRAANEPSALALPWRANLYRPGVVWAAVHPTPTRLPRTLAPASEPRPGTEGRTQPTQ